MAFRRWSAVYIAAQVQQRVNVRHFGQYKSASGRSNFFDRAVIRASGGKGGDGCISFNGKSLDCCKFRSNACSSMTS